MNLLFGVDGDEVSPVERAANRKRFALLKGDTMPDVELEDMLSVPWEHEGAMIDLLRKEGADESVQKAMVAAIRLAKGVEEDLPEPLRSVVEKLGREMYPLENEALNKDGKPAKGEKPGDSADDTEPDNDKDDVTKRDFSAAERRSAASSGAALPDGSYPIKSQGDLSNAIQAIGRAKDRGRAMAHIKSRARSLGLTRMLPEAWGVSKEAPEDPEFEDGNVIKEDTVAEEVHVAVPVQKEDGTWDMSGVPEDAKPVWTAVLKSNEVLGEKLTKADEEIAALKNTLSTKDFIAKAEESFDALAPADELGPILKAASESLDEESFEKLEGILKGAAERVASGDLFKEMGRAALDDGSRTDAYATAVAKAEEKIEKSTEGLSKDQAIAAVFDEHPELYSQYLIETAGGVK